MYSKLVTLISILVVSIIFMSGCGQGRNASEQTASDRLNADKKFTIVTSFYPIYVSTINIAKDVPDVQVINMTKPQTGCLHDYQLTPEDLKTLEKADVFIVNGAGMENFIDKTIKQYPDLKIIEASKGISLVKNDNNEANPHVWISITNNILQVKTIAEQLRLIDTDHSSKYKSNSEDYIKKLDSLKTKMHQSLDGVKNKNIITFHEAFPYFAKEFNLNIAAVIEREPGTEPSPRELEATIKTVRDVNIKALFAEPQYSAKAADVIARESGARVYTLDPVVTGDNSLNSYINIMEQNLRILEEALK